MLQCKWTGLWFEKKPSSIYNIIKHNIYSCENEKRLRSERFQEYQQVNWRDKNDRK